MQTRISVAFTAVFAAFLTAPAGCSATGDGPATALPGGPVSIACSRDAVIEDGENNDHQVLVHDGRGGYIYTFRGGDTKVEPTAGADGGTFTMSEGGANGSHHAARMHGTIGGGAPDFVGLGFNLMEPQGPFDGSGYKGISFFARRGPTSVGTVRVKVPDKNTFPAAGVCTECYNDFGASVELTEEWKAFVFEFHELSQLPGWGSPQPAGLDETTIYGLQFQVASPGADFDIWLDDLAFVGCKDE